MQVTYIQIYLDNNTTKYVSTYHMAQNFDGENIDEFDKFPAIRQYFPNIRIFHLVSYLLLMNLWRSRSTQNEIVLVRHL